MVTIGKYSFEGPLGSTAQLQDRSGIYAVLDRRTDGTLHVVDVGESSAVKSRLESHDRDNCWQRNRLGTLLFAVYYTPGQQQAGRMQIEQELRDIYHPACGSR